MAVIGSSSETRYDGRMESAKAKRWRCQAIKRARVMKAISPQLSQDEAFAAARAAMHRDIETAARLRNACDRFGAAQAASYRRAQSLFLADPGQIDPHPTPTP